MRPRFRRAVEYGFCLAVLLLAPLAVLLPGVLMGRVALSTDGVFAFTPWEEARPAGLSPPAGPEANLMAQRYYPWYVFMSQAGSPCEALWDPMESGGLPFFAQWQTRCLSPFSIPFYLGSPGTALTLSIYLKLLAAGLCALYAARRLGFHRPMALFVGLAFQLSAGLILWWGSPISDVLPWLPLLVLYCERLALGHYRMWSTGALVIGLMLLGGDPQSVAVFLLLAALILITRFKLDGRGLKGALIPLLVLGVSTAVSLCLAAVQIVPFIEFFRASYTTGLRPREAALSIWDLSQLALPHLPGAFRQALRAGDSPLQTAGLLHVGIAQIALLPVWLAMRPFANVRQRHRIEALLLPSLSLTLLAFLWGPVLRLIPWVNAIGPHHYLAANAFLLALSAAATAEEWIHLNADDCQNTLKRLLIPGPLFLAVVAALAVFGGRRPGLPESLSIQAIAPGCLFLALLIVLGVTIFKPSARLIGYSLCAIALVNALSTYGLAIPFTKAGLVYPETQFIRLLRKSGGRVSGSEALARWPLQANLVPQIYGCSGVTLRRQADYHARIQSDPLLLRRMGSAMLLLNQDDIQGKFAPVRPILRVEQVFPSGAVLFFDSESQSRARMVYEGRATESYEPGKLASDAAPLMEDAIPPAGPPPEGGTASVAPSTSNRRVEVNVETKAKGVLVLADTWYPGWTAAVDGKPAEVFPVDLMFRGVEVPEGAKEVVFEYNPLWVRIGAYVSAGAAAVVALGLLALLPAAIQRLRHRRKWEY